MKRKGSKPEEIRVAFVFVNPMVRYSLVGPIGCERLAAILLSRPSGNFSVFISVPFIERAWRRALLRDLRRADPHLVCLSFRNLDECVLLKGDWASTKEGKVSGLSFFKALQDVVGIVRGITSSPIVLGGPGFASAPLPILRSLGVRFGVIGPGEPALEAWASLVLEGKGPEEALSTLAGRLGVVDLLKPQSLHMPRNYGTFPFGPILTPRHPAMLEILKLADERIPVVAAYGCSRRCRYCIEPSLTKGRVIARKVCDIIAEISALYRQGFRKFWLTCSELNSAGPSLAVEFFRGLAKQRLRDLDIRTYLCVGGINEELLDAMEEAGQRPFEYSFEFGHLAERPLKEGFGPGTLRAFEALVNLFLQRGYPTLGGTILLGGPCEDLGTLEECVRRAHEVDRAFPQGLGLTLGIGVRLYPGSKFGEEVLKDPKAHLPFLFPRRRKGLDGLLPIFYCRPEPPYTLAQLVAKAFEDLKGGVEIATSMVGQSKKQGC